MRAPEYIAGKRFGSLVGIKDVGSRYKKRLWLMQCDCGKQTISTVGDLKRKDGKATTSCGCGRKRSWEPIFENGVCKIPLAKKDPEYAIIDAEDYEKVKGCAWSRTSQGYVRYVVPYGRQINLARLIMNTPDGLVVDHMNHNILDNRKANLRNCTDSENVLNRKPYKNKRGDIVIPKGYLGPPVTFED